MMKMIRQNKLLNLIFLALVFLLYSANELSASGQKAEYISPSALNYFITGKIYEYQQDYTNALENYKQGLVFDPFSSIIRHNVASILIRKNDIQGAIKQLSAAVESDKNDYESRILLSAIMFSRGDIEETKKLLLEAKQTDPMRIDAYLKLSDLYLFTKDEKSALEVLNEMLKNSPDKSEAYLRIGNIYLNRRNIKQAIESFINALRINPANRDAAVMLSVAFELEEKYDNAIEVLKKAQKYVSDDIEIILLIGKLYLRKEDFISARLFFNYALRNSPDTVSASVAIANIYSQEGYYSEAEKIYQSLINEHRNNDELKYYYGRILMTMKRYEEGVELLNRVNEKRLTGYARSLICASYLERKKYEKALECVSGDESLNETTFFIKAESLLGMKKYEEARKFLESAVKIRELWCDAIIYLSRVYEKIISKEASISLLTEATNRYDILTDEKIRILYEIGMIYERNSKINEAIEVMKIILKLNPENPEALNFIGYTYIDNNINLEQAKEMVLKAYMYSSRSGAIIDSVGWMYYKLNDYQTALRYLKKAYRLLPEEPIIADHLADTYMKLNYFKEAKEIYEKILKMENLDEKLKESVNKKLNDLSKPKSQKQQ
ncbi:MAG: tetratricopeptide repeat protein [Deltaproteobacteria bacterium]|nr:tetratricopeptide repeat protein [Deltaproteobacteria bacterium]